MLIIVVNPLGANPPLSKIIGKAIGANSLSVKQTNSNSFLSMVSELITEAKNLLTEGQTIRTTNLSYTRIGGQKTTVDYTLRKANTPYLPGQTARDALYRVSLTQCLKTGEIKTQFSEKSRIPGVEVPPLSDSEKRMIVAEMAKYVERILPLKKTTKLLDKDPEELS